MPIVPLFGDRSAWDASHYPTLHADDMVAGDTHHPPLTIGGNAGGMFYLVNEQELTLAHQQPEYFLVGPINAPSAPPTFRPVRLDQALIDVSILGPQQNDALLYETSLARWRNRQIDAGIVYLIDSAGYFATDTVEDGMWYLAAHYTPRQHVARTLTGSDDLRTNDDAVVCNSGSALSVNLPNAIGSGRLYLCKNIGAGTATLDAAGSDTIDSAGTLDLAQWEFAQILDYATGQWLVIG